MPDADLTAPVLETERLLLYRFTPDDAALAFEIVNDPSFIQYIGDRGVRTQEDARNYLLKGPLASYDQHGFGLFKVVRRADGRPIGMCGLLKRETLEHADVGYALLPAFWSQGYAREAVAGTLEYARRVHRLGRVVAIVQPDNPASIKVLEHTGFTFERSVQLSPDAQPLSLYGRSL